MKMRKEKIITRKNKEEKKIKEEKIKKRNNEEVKKLRRKRNKSYQKRTKIEIIINTYVEEKKHSSR